MKEKQSQFFNPVILCHLHINRTTVYSELEIEPYVSGQKIGSSWVFNLWSILLLKHFGCLPQDVQRCFFLVQISSFLRGNKWLFPLSWKKKEATWFSFLLTNTRQSLFANHLLIVVYICAWSNTSLRIK